MPATTMVAAWISAETGVGPAMASGNQVWRMNWPDFDITAASSASEATSSVVWLMSPATAWLLMSTIENVPPAAQNRMITPQISQTSPTRLVRNALRAASLLGFSSHQWPIRTKEQTPTNSHRHSSWSVVLLMISPSIEAVNSE